MTAANNGMGLRRGRFKVNPLFEATDSQQS